MLKQPNPEFYEILVISCIFNSIVKPLIDVFFGSWKCPLYVVHFIFWFTYIAQYDTIRCRFQSYDYQKLKSFLEEVYLIKP